MGQLFMRKSNLNDESEIKEIKLPSGYEMRTYQPGDEAAWSYIMSKTIGGDPSPERCSKDIIQKPQFSPDILFFVTHHETPVGSACAWRKSPDEKETGYVHMVGVLEEHRGKNLGYILTLKTLHWFRDRGFKCAVLHTDDFRIPAVKIYLKLGFVPVFVDDTHTPRWKALKEKLGIPIPGVE